MYDYDVGDGLGDVIHVIPILAGGMKRNLKSLNVADAK